jgi:hypothetical protein
MTEGLPGKPSAPRIGVYRMNQIALQSSCLLGDPCPVCRLHASCHGLKRCRDCRRGRAWNCERAYLTPPAFTVQFKQALALINQGLAVFIHRNKALRLTFSKITQLRDRSLKVDEQLLMDYALGVKYARAIIEDPTAGWAVQPTVVERSGDVAQKDKERVLYFA